MREAPLAYGFPCHATFPCWDINRVDLNIITIAVTLHTFIVKATYPSDRDRYREFHCNIINLWTPNVLFDTIVSAFLTVIHSHTCVCPAIFPQEHHRDHNSTRHLDRIRNSHRKMTRLSFPKGLLQQNRPKIVLLESHTCRAPATSPISASLIASMMIPTVWFRFSERNSCMDFSNTSHLLPPKPPRRALAQYASRLLLDPVNAENFRNGLYRTQGHHILWRCCMETNTMYSYWDKCRTWLARQTKCMTSKTIARRTS